MDRDTHRLSAKLENVSHNGITSGVSCICRHSVCVWLAGRLTGLDRKEEHLDTDTDTRQSDGPTRGHLVPLGEAAGGASLSTVDCPENRYKEILAFLSLEERVKAE